MAQELKMTFNVQRLHPTIYCFFHRSVEYCEFCRESDSALTHMFVIYTLCNEYRKGVGAFSFEDTALQLRVFSVFHHGEEAVLNEKVFR